MARQAAGVERYGPDERTPLIASAGADGAIPQPDECLVEQGADPERAGDEDAARKTNIILIFPALAIGVFLAAFDQTVIASTYAKIGSEFNRFNDVSWIATSYMISSTAFQPLYGRLSDIFGRKNALLSANIIFGLSCFFCGVNLPFLTTKDQQFWGLVTARLFAGVGGAGMLSASSITMSDLVPLRDRASWQGYTNVIFALGSSCGAPLGGQIADTIGWRWVFILQAPMTLVALVSIIILLKLPRKGHPEFDSKPLREKLKIVDWLGCLTLVATVTFFVFAFNMGGNTRAWSDPLVATCLIGGLVSFVLFILTEKYWSNIPMAPLHVITPRPMLAPYMANFFQFLGQMSLVYAYPLFFQVLRHESAAQAGGRLIPFIVGGSSGSLLAGVIVRKTGHYKMATMAAYLLCIVGTLGMTSITATSSLWQYTLHPLLIGLGNGIGVTLLLIAIIHACDKNDQAVAIGLSYLFRASGVVLGVSGSTNLLFNVLRWGLEKHLDVPDTVKERIISNVKESVEAIWDLDPEIAQVVVAQYATAIRAIFYMVVATNSLAFISSVFIKDEHISHEG